MALKLVLSFFSLLIVVITLLPFIRSDFWIFRILEYLRLQKLMAGFILTLTIVFTYSFLDGWFWWIIIPLGMCLIYLCTQVFPYTFLGAKEMNHANELKPEAGLKVFTANVLMDNQQYDKMLQQIKMQDPDIVFLVETDRKWEEATRILSKDYPYSLKRPMDNTYGLLFFSRLTVKEGKVNFLVEDDVPSIEATLLLANGVEVKLYGLHPKPPVPYESLHTTAKDKELMKVALAIKNLTSPCIVFGDLNDVAWSRTTKLFRTISRLLDPRLGRSFYSTFSAKKRWLRFPLDYIFCSSHFVLHSMKRMPKNGSDHFAMFIHLQYNEALPKSQTPQKPDDEAIKKAIEKATAETKD